MSAALCCRCKYRKTELFLIYSLAAREGKYHTSRTDFLECNGIQTGISLQRVTECILVFCKGGRVKNNQVVVASGTFQIFKGILTKSLMTMVVREVQCHIGICQFYRFG